MGHFAPSLVPYEAAVPARQQIVSVSPKTRKALKEHRLDLRCTPEEFRRRHPGTDATLLAIAAGASLNTIHKWGLFKYGSKRAQFPKEHHLILLGEASEFLFSLN